jgi:hypothetical protein
MGERFFDDPGARLAGRERQDLRFNLTTQDAGFQR